MNRGYACSPVRRPRCARLRRLYAGAGSVTLEERVGPMHGVTFDNDLVEQDAVQYLEDRSPVFAKKLNAC